MGIRILGVGVHRDPTVNSAIDHAVAAGKRAIEDARVPLEDVGLLLHTGIYRDSNLVEPAIAALIQKGIGLNLDYVKYYNGKPAFSFDVMNGACGPLNAVQVATAALLTQSVRYVLIVSADIHPSGEPVEGFPYTPVGGAFLLGRDESSQGFGPMSVSASSDEDAGREGYLSYIPGDTQGRRRIVVNDAPDYGPRLLDFATQAVREHQADYGISLDRTLLVTSNCTSDLGPRLAQRLGMKGDDAVRVAGVEGDPHTSSLALGYHTAREGGRLGAYEQVLFVGVGSGLTSVVASYHLA